MIIEGDTPSVSDYFPSCKNYERSINITVEDDYTLIKDTVDNFAEIRTILFNEGPILAFMDSKYIFLIEISRFRN